MKNLVLKNAWILIKNLGYSKSEAFKQSWAAFKNNVIIFIDSKKRVVYKKEIFNYTLFKSDFLELLKEASSILKPHNSDGAAHYYGIGAYNGD